MTQAELNQQLIDAVNAHGADLQNLNCVIAGLVHQLAATQGKEGLEGARKFALQVAEAIPKMDQFGLTQRSFLSFSASILWLDAEFFSTRESRSSTTSNSLGPSFTSFKSMANLPAFTMI